MQRVSPCCVISPFASRLCAKAVQANLRPCVGLLFAGVCVEISRAESCDEDVVKAVPHKNTKVNVDLPCCMLFSPIVFEMWLLTPGPLIGISVIFAELSKR